MIPLPFQDEPSISMQISKNKLCLLMVAKKWRRADSKTPNRLYEELPEESIVTAVHMLSIDMRLRYVEGKQHPPVSEITEYNE